jgi:hypothetical protein
VAALATALKDRETRRAGLNRDLARLEDRRVTSLIDPRRIERDLRKRVADWRRLLTQHTPIARQIVTKLLEDRIVWTPQPEEKRYLFEVMHSPTGSSRA